MGFVPSLSLSLSLSLTIFLLFAISFPPSAAEISIENQQEIVDWSGNSNNRELIELNDGPPADDLVWVVQLSDLHFSVHHPERAHEFREIVGPTLKFIKPSLVMLTGDLTDGKSKDLLTMKQDKEEWIEYQKVMQDVVKRSGLNETTFYDVRGNHDNFGVPFIGGPFDFFSNYSINGRLKRTGKVNSVTIQTGKRKLLFVGFDSTMSSGIRGPTNLFGHPTDELLTELNSELSQWDSQTSQPVTKITFGHFPLSFSAASKSGKTLKDIFLENSLSAYLCGHLHKKFGKNLKRHHYNKQLFQLNGHASYDSESKEFWEFEMADWRKNRAMRILAIDGGRVSFLDIDFVLGSKKTFILPTFPLDSRFMSTKLQNYKCTQPDTTCGAIRALVFSSSPIVSVFVRIYDSSFGNLNIVMETPMKKLAGNLYFAPWNIKAFTDPDPERYLLQIEATDVNKLSTVTELRPFSVNGVPAKLRWTWKEFIVMGCEWDSLYLPILWSFYFLVLCILVVPRLLLSFSRQQYSYRSFGANRGFVSGMGWAFTELYNVPLASYCMIGYLFYLLLCPWFYGQVFTEAGERGYMTYKGWVSKFDDLGKIEFVGFPDVMVVVLSHLFWVVLPAIVGIVVLSGESGIYRDLALSVSSKKKDDYDGKDKESALNNNCIDRRLEMIIRKRWIRKFFVMVSLAICWKHFKNCVFMMKAYEMNPVIHFPVYSFLIPSLLAYTIWKTGKSFNGSYQK